MNITDCPHCLMRVAVSADNTCPSCGQDTTKEPAIPSGYSLLTIEPHQRLPRICILCGTHTKHLHRLIDGDEYAATKRILGNMARLMLGAFTGLFIFGWKSSGDKIGSLPICKQCSSRVSYRPQHINRDSTAMQCLVCDAFKDQYEAQMHDRLAGD